MAKAGATVKRLKNDLAGAITKKDTVTQVFSACVRSILQYGTQVKSLSAKQLEKLKSTDAALLCELVNKNRHILRISGKNYNDIFREYKMLPFVPLLQYLRAKSFGHTLRRPYDSKLRMVMVGEIFPALNEQTTTKYAGPEEGEFLYYYPTTEVGKRTKWESGNAARGILEDNIEFFESHDIPIELIDYISRPLGEEPAKGETAAYIRNKRFFLSIIDNILLNDTAEYYAAGNKSGESEVKDAVESIRKRRNLSQDHLNLADPLLKHGKCPICRWDGKAFSFADKETLRAHVRDTHGPFQGEICSEAAEVANNKSDDFFLSYRADKMAEIEFRYREYFEKTSKISNKGRGTGNVLPRFQCFKCKLTFGTSHEAMARHAEAHKNDDYRFIGKFDVAEDNPNFGLFNPSTHRFDKQYDHFTFSTQAKLHCVQVPVSAQMEDGRIKCRYCSKFQPEFGGKNPKNQMKTAKKMMNHEARCRKEREKKKSKKAGGDELGPGKKG